MHSTGLSPLSYFLILAEGMPGKSENFSAIYCVTTFLSLMLLIGYCAIAQKKSPWYLLLFTSVLVVNIGYLALALSKNLDEALLANRLAYLGSVFLPLSMCMIILNATHIPHKKWLPGLLLCVGVVVFFIAASPGYLDIYYKEVYFQKVNGVTILKKVYGPLHSIYPIYLLGYFAAMVGFIIHGALTKKIRSIGYTTILALSVFVNMGVWLIEQLVQVNFEILSVSYIICGGFLLALHLLIQEAETKHPLPSEDPIPSTKPDTPDEAIDPTQLNYFQAGLMDLTRTEKLIYNFYTEGRTTKEIMAELNITENTLKFHNKNIYEKLGVASRKQLQKLHRHIQ